MTITYDGHDFHGWARQAEQRTVQGEIERVLHQLIRADVNVQCAGRTDSGVSARGQVAHVDVPQELTAPTLERINRAMPDDIRILDLKPAAPGFDARFSALWRKYSYRVCDHERGPDPLHRRFILDHPRHLDVDAMNHAATALLGEHDFAAYCKLKDTGTTIRTLLECHWQRDDHGDASLRITADAFCHSMVRSIVGALIPVGEGRRPHDWPRDILVSQERNSGVTVMPAHPLILEEVGYPADADLAKRQRVTRQVREIDVEGTSIESTQRRSTV